MDELHASLSIPLHRVGDMNGYNELMSSDKKIGAIKVINV